MTNPPPDPTADRLTLRGPKGLELILFGPREQEWGVEADIVALPSGPIPKPCFMKSGARRFRVPAIPGPGLHVAYVALRSVK